MYDWIQNRFGSSLANVLYGLWYAVILLVIVIIGSTPETTLRYLEL